jgi:hypothetical protein
LCVNSDVEQIWMLSSRLIDKATVASPDVYNYAPVWIGCDEIMECSSIELVESFAANYLKHKILPFRAKYSCGYNACHYPKIRELR